MLRASSLALVIALSACVPNPAPQRWLPVQAAVPSDVFGAWIVITAVDSAVVEGEFLAVDRDTVWVLRDDGLVQSTPTARVQSSRIAWYDIRYQQTAMLAALGALTTFSHGGFLILTMPMWAIAGSAAAASDSKAPLVDPVQIGWDSARMYARYPTGLPPAFPARLPTKPTAK
jgi:hypothetical protein